MVVSLILSDASRTRNFGCNYLASAVSTRLGPGITLIASVQQGKVGIFALYHRVTQQSIEPIECNPRLELPATATVRDLAWSPLNVSRGELLAVATDDAIFVFRVPIAVAINTTATATATATATPPTPPLGPIATSAGQFLSALSCCPPPA